MRPGVRVAVLVILTATATTCAWATPAEHAELVFKWINFALLFGVLVYFLHKPLRRYFAGQRQAIQGALAEARKLHEEAQRRLAEIEQRLTRLEEEIAAMREHAAADIVAEQQRIQAIAERESERILATARAEIDSATRAARLELKAYVARLALTQAEARIRQQLTPAMHTALFEAFLRNFDRQQT